MKKHEVFGLWLCLLGIFLFVFGVSDDAVFMILAAFAAFVVGSVFVLSSLWNRRKDK